MLNWSNNYKIIGIVFFLGFFADPAYSEDYSAKIKNIIVEVKPKSPWFTLNADINFKLSPIAKEALQKGIVLTWVIVIKVEQEGWFWNTVLEEKQISYKIKNHELLNLYSVDENGVVDMFSTLKASFNAISKIRNLAIINKQEIQKNKQILVAVKVLFDREALPIPLRPISYFDSQWALSSQWAIWQQKK
ncbi:MAG: DUF4390 domain-containing protein [Methylococcales bacterium]|nr:DUF4390 domain-containing protein [Methylococcales bacterium]